MMPAASPPPTLASVAGIIETLPAPFSPIPVDRLPPQSQSSSYTPTPTEAAQAQANNCTPSPTTSMAPSASKSLLLPALTVLVT